MNFNIKKETTIDSSREEVLVKMLNERDAKKGVEVGVFKGEFSKILLSGWNGKLYMVDPWRPLGGDYIDKTNHAHHDSIYQDAINSIKGYENRAIMIRALSEEAIDLFEDNSLDFVYIDANHGYSYVKQDLELWWPKLKSGGIMSGHDFIMVDWDNISKQSHGKNTHIYSEGTKWQIKGYYDPNNEMPHGGIFGVNPAVHEFSQKHGIDYDLTREWASTFIMTKP
tara:strand:- start:1896 stop:2570 length:675 start_codon:yes stop_codon:yes gene_type:complete